MFRQVSISLFLVLLISCSGNQKEKVLNMEDLTPHATHEKVTQDKKQDSLIPALFDLISADKCGIRIQEFTELDQPMFPDRFMPKNKVKLTLHAKETSFLFGQWNYADSTKTRNAFYNWLDCFGPECKTVKLGEEVNMLNEAFLCFINDTSITYLSSQSKVDPDKWQCYLEKIYGIDQWDLVIMQQPGKKAVWMKYVQLPKKKKKQFLPLE